MQFFFSLARDRTNTLPNKSQVKLLDVVVPPRKLADGFGIFGFVVEIRGERNSPPPPPLFFFPKRGFLNIPSRFITPDLVFFFFLLQTGALLCLRVFTCVCRAARCFTLRVRVGLLRSSKAAELQLWKSTQRGKKKQQMKSGFSSPLLK